MPCQNCATCHYARMGCDRVGRGRPAPLVIPPGASFSIGSSAPPAPFARAVTLIDTANKSQWPYDADFGLHNMGRLVLTKAPIGAERSEATDLYSGMLQPGP